jgi:hypothetical protein
MTLKILKPTVDFLAAPIWDKGGHVFNVCHPDFGAVADWNGTTGTDNITALNAARDAALAAGGCIFIPPGNYYKNAQWLIDTSGAYPITVLSEGAEFYDGPSVTGYSIKCTGSSGSYRGPRVLGLRFNHRNNTTVGGCIEFNGASHGVIDGINVLMHNTKAGYALIALTTLTPGNDNTCCFWTRIDNVICRQLSGGDGTFADYGVLLQGGQNMTWIGKGCSFGSVNKAIGFTVDTNVGSLTLANGCDINGPAFEGVVTGVDMVLPTAANGGYASTGNRVTNCRVESVTNLVSLTPLGGAVVGTGNLVISGGAGVGVFGSSQAGANIANGKYIKLAGTDYLVTAFNGTTGVTVTTLDGTGFAPNGTYASFSAYPSSNLPSDPLTLSDNYCSNISVVNYLYNPANVVVNVRENQAYATAKAPNRAQSLDHMRNVIDGTGKHFVISNISGGSSYANAHLCLGDPLIQGFAGHIWINGADGSLWMKYGAIPPTSATDGVMVAGYGVLQQLYGLKILTSTGKIIQGSTSLAIRDSTDASNNLLVTDGGIVTMRNAFGYAAGIAAGGTVTQATSKATGVTLNKVTGEITMNAAALASGAVVQFTLTNSTVLASDFLVIDHVSGGTLGSYQVSMTPAAGSVLVTVKNTSAGSLSEAIVLRYLVLRAATT